MKTKQLLLFLVGISLSATAFGATITSSGGGGNWNTPGTWVGGVVPAAGDDVVIQSTVTINAASTCAGVTINSGELKWQNKPNFTVNGDFVINNGKFTHDNNQGGAVFLSGDFIYNGGTYDVTSQTCTNVIIHFLKAGSKIAGTSAAELKFLNITVNLPSDNDVLTLERNISLGNPNGIGNLILTKGIFNPNGQTIKVGKEANFNLNGGGVFGSSANGYTDANLELAGGSGANVTVNGAMTVNNVSFSGDGNVKFPNNTSAQVTINGTFTRKAQSTTVNTPLTWGPNSTLIIDGINNYPNNGNWKEWTPTATSGAGFVNNLILQGNTALQLTSDANIGGTLTINSTANGNTITVTNNYAITCGGLKIESGKTLKLGNKQITVKGDFTNNGTFTHSNQPVFLTGTALQTIGGTTATTFYDLQLNNPAGALLAKPTTVSNTLTLTNGVLATIDPANTLTLTSTNAISGGSTTAYINGAVSKNIAAGSNTFPMGKGEDYLPITFTGNAAATVTVEAILGDCGGTPDTEGETPVYLLDDTKYWKVTAASEMALSDILIAPMPADFDQIVASKTLDGTYGVIDESITGTEFYFTFASSTPPPAEIYFDPEDLLDFGTLSAQNKGQTSTNVTGRYLFHNVYVEIRGEDAGAFTLVGSLDGILEIPYRSILATGGTNIGVVFNIDKALANKVYSATLVIWGEDLDEEIAIPLTGTMNISSGLLSTDADNARVIGYYSLLGTRLAKAPDSGVYIIVYDNGKAEKIIR